tara:strand:+ start:218 stop:700 length:483 start_codon:yes stop_codon:yes gene_type:complete
MSKASSTVLLSGLDWQILHALQVNGRIPISDLATQLNRSRSSISEHIRKLQDMGVIEGFSVRINEEKVGVGLSAFVRLQADSSQHRKIVETVDQIPEVAECHVLTGTDLLMMRVVAKDMAHLRDLVDGFTRWGATTTDVIFSTVKHQLGASPLLRRKLER